MADLGLACKHFALTNFFVLEGNFQRTQFPLQLAFAMTINKAQGQTLKHVGLCLTEPVFTHGQLYVAVSRITDGANLRIIVPDTLEARREGKIKNVVYSGVFS